MIGPAISNLRPGAAFKVDDTYDTLVWQDTVQSKPTEAEVDAEVARLKTAWANSQYQRNRADEYPSIGDQLDALWKGGDAAASMLERVQAIKAKYPKPGGV